MAWYGRGLAALVGRARVLIDHFSARAHAVRAGALPRRGRAVRLDDVRRRLELLVTAVYDRPIPIAVADARRRASWSRFTGLASGSRGRGVGALPSTDGERILLPRQIENTDAEAALATYRLMAIEQAERIVRGTPTLVGVAATPMERDLYLMHESLAVDAAIARAVPGLRPALTRARELALAHRPPLAGLTSAERAVEQMLRRALERDAAGTTELTSATPAASLTRAREAAAALRAAGRRYRGIAPVPAWGLVTASPNAPDGWPPREADDLATLEGGKYGGGWHGRGSREGGRQVSDAGAEEGAADDPNRAGDAESSHGPMDAPARGRGDRSESESAGGERSGEPPREDVGDVADAAPSSPARAGGPSAMTNGTRARPRGRLPAPKPVDGGVEYPEWDWQAGDYRASGAVVRAHEPESSDDRWGDQVLARYGPLVRQLRERFERLRARRARLGQQRDGDELDLAACVRALVDQRTGHAVDDRLYIAVRPARRGLAIALLIDVSGSTDEWIDTRRRIIDVEKVALLLASEALDALGDLYAVLTFSGKGRGNVRMRTIKGFDEPNGRPVRRRIAALEPEGYTRAGAAVRHATALLERQPAAHRLLLMISDGRPNDVDEYEGPSAVEDTRQAIIEARGRGVYPFCLTIDRQGQDYLARIFGEAGHAVLRNPQQLPVALVKVVKHLLAT